MGKAVPGHLVEPPLPDPLPPLWKRVLNPAKGIAGERDSPSGTRTQGGARYARLPWARILRPYGAENPLARQVQFPPGVSCRNPQKRKAVGLASLRLY